MRGQTGDIPLRGAGHPPACRLVPYIQTPGTKLKSQDQVFIRPVLQLEQQVPRDALWGLHWPFLVICLLSGRPGSSRGGRWLPSELPLRHPRGTGTSPSGAGTPQ